MNSTCAPAGALGSTVPPKDWDKQTLDERIERMREVVKDLSRSLGYSQVSLHNLRRKLKNHKHTEAGKVVEEKEIQEYDDENNSLVGSSTLSANNFF